MLEYSQLAIATLSRYQFGRRGLLGVKQSFKDTNDM